MRTKLIVMVASVLTVSAGAAMAAPVPKFSVGEFSAGKPGVTTVADHYDHRDWKRRHWRGRDWERNRHWDRDRRYERYRGWHRYGHRPWNWRARNCIAVGPFWFCP